MTAGMTALNDQSADTQNLAFPEVLVGHWQWDHEMFFASALFLLHFLSKTTTCVL